MTPLERAGFAAQEAIATAYGEGLESRAWRDYVARAVMHAIREPSEAMALIGATESEGRANVRKVWEKMIDAALGENL